MIVKGKWVDTILYEIPLLALTSEAYFKFIDKDWTYDGQVENAREKGLRLVEAGCIVSEFGSRRRRDYHTHDLILTGLMQAQEEGDRKGWTGKISGTSNVHFAMKYNIHPIGTVAHEWFMGVAAITDNYKTATETALDYWVATFGRGVLSIALTDTFGTPTFLRAFRKPAPLHAVSGSGATSTFPTADATPGERSGTITSNNDDSESQESYASIFNGTRQDSGDPLEFVKTMRRFYDSEGITTKKAIVFSDALNVDRCIQYRSAAIDAGFAPSFGVGTNFTNDFRRTSDRQKSVPMNIVIKLSSAGGKHAVKISDNIGKNTGDRNTVERVKRELAYTEIGWMGDGDETKRWG
jgi:nicotinate phosphoribosyltransferase